MKFLKVFALILIFAFYNSCRVQNQADVINDHVNKGNHIETKIIEADSTKVPISMVRNVKQAGNGDILVASFFGVFRYDGKSFTNITSGISPPESSNFWDVHEDRKGNLWFGTRHSGIYMLPFGQTTFRHFTTKDGLASDMALNIYEDKAGNIWFGSIRYDGKSFKNLSTKDGFPSNNIRLLLEDKTGKQWFCAQNEDMYVYDGKTFTVLKDKEGKPFNNVWGITEDKKGNIWFGADGLVRYDGKNFTKVSQRGAYAIIQDKKGNLWTTGGIDSRTWSLSRYDAKSLYSEKPTMTEIKSSNELAFLGLLEANDGNIWFGSARNGSTAHFGVFRFEGNTITEFRPKASVK